MLSAMSAIFSIIYPNVLTFCPFPCNHISHDDVIKWKHFPRYWPFARGIHRSPVNSPHKGQRRGALMFSVISAQINGWVNNREAGDLRCIRLHYDVTVMSREMCHGLSPEYKLQSGPWDTIGSQRQIDLICSSYMSRHIDLTLCALNCLTKYDIFTSSINSREMAQILGTPASRK